MSRSKTALATAIALLALCGCGSRVSTVAGAGLPAAGDDSLAGPTASGPSAAGGMGGTAPAEGTGPAVAGMAGAGAAAAGMTGPSTVTCCSGAASHSAGASAYGPGVTATTVRLGFHYVDTGTGTAGVLGKNVSIGNPVAMARAMRDWINTHGGMGGRRLDLDVYGVAYDAYVRNSAEADEEVCTHFTQDEKVLAVAVYVPTRQLVECLAGHGVASDADGYPLDDAELDALSDFFYMPGAMSQNRGAAAGVDGLAAAGFLKGAKIGLVRYDDPVYARAEATLKDALGRHGLAIAQDYEVNEQSTSAAESDVASAALRFRQSGITHVMFLDNSGGLAYAFMAQAQSQQWFPKYPLTTNNGPSALAQLAPSAQLANAMAVSWWWGDVGDAKKQQTPPALPDSKARCDEIMRAAGVDISGNAKGTALIACDQLLFFKTLLDHASAPNVPSMRTVADALGTRYQSPVTYRTVLGPGRHDGATLTRVIGWNTSCGCWHYRGPGPSSRSSTRTQG